MGLLSGRMLNPKMLKCLLPEPAANGKPATCSTPAKRRSCVANHRAARQGVSRGIQRGTLARKSWSSVPNL